MLDGVLAKQFKVPQPVAVAEENVITPIATLGNVMRTTRNDDTSKTRHGTKLPIESTHGNPQIGERSQLSKEQNDE